MYNSMSYIKKIVLSAMFLALGLALPFLTGPALGSVFLPMHLPILLCGFIVGSPWGMAIGFICPLLRSVLFFAPPMYPVAVSMAFELAAYGFVAGFLYKRVPRQNLSGIYISLISAMVVGRIIWGLTRWIMMAFGTQFSISVFIAGGFITALPGIIIQLIAIPVILIALQKAKSMT